MDKHTVASGRTRNWLWGILPGALAVLLTASGTAQAEMLYLKCGDDTVTVDLTNNTLDGHPATITATSIDSHLTGVAGGQPGVTYESSMHIDRVTGTYTKNSTVQLANGRVLPVLLTSSSCTKGTAPETKF